MWITQPNPGSRLTISAHGIRARLADTWQPPLALPYDGRELTRFTFEPGTDGDPIWSPDGSRVVWASNREGRFQLYEKAASGLGQDALLLKSDYSKFPSDWSRDGRFIIYREVDPKTNYDVWVLPIGPAGPVEPPAGDQKPFPFLHTEANEAAAVLSPDGQWMAYISDESGRYEVYVQSFPKGGSKRQARPAEASCQTGGGTGKNCSTTLRTED